MRVEKRIWDFVQKTHELHQSKRINGFTLLECITITSIDNYYLVHCYNHSSGKRISFKISIDHKLFGDDPHYKISDMDLSDIHSSLGIKVLAEQVWEFMIPIMRDINLKNIGICEN